MGTANPYKPEKLILGVLLTAPERLGELQHKLEGLFGGIDYSSPVMDFRFSRYYDEEMGAGIKRLFFSFEDLVFPDSLPEIKLATNELERAFAVNGKRKVNLDPGLLNLSRLILASTKDNMHRIPLRKGIYGEVTLVFMHKAFHSLLWTYPDYASEEYKTVLTEIREILREQLKRRAE